MLSALSSRQRDAVTHPGGPLLILGGPVTGKTHTLLARASHRLTERGDEPHRVLILTATLRGTRTVRQALAATGLVAGDTLKVSTFELIALEILRHQPPLAGQQTDCVVWDEPTCREMLAAAVQRLGLSLAQWPPDRLRQHLAACRGNLRDPTTADEDHPADQTQVAIVQNYLEFQRQAMAIDPDDLVPRAVRLLEAQPEILAAWQAHWPTLLVDDFQEISRAQYGLLRLLAPPPDGDVTITAGPDEAILARPGADPRLLEQFRREYQPIVVEFHESYASELILQAASRFLTRQPVPVPQPTGVPIYHYTFADHHIEARWIGELIHRLIRDRGYSYGDIAILSRTYRLASPLAKMLNAAGSPIQRIPRESFFGLRGVQEILRQLRLLTQPIDLDVRAGINFPYPWLDNLTLAQLDRLARQQNLSWLELCRRAGEFSDISPLTRARLRAWAARIDRGLNIGGPAKPVTAATPPVDTAQVLPRLFAILEAWRNPFTADEQQRLRAWVAQKSQGAEEQGSRGAGESSGHFSEAVGFLQKAIAARRPIALVAPASVEGAAGVAILELALKSYLNHPVSVHMIGLTEGPAAESVAFNAVPVILGRTTRATLPDAPARKAVVLDVGSQKPLTSLTAQAWWLAGSLLAAYEQPLAGRLVVCEVKTTGPDVRQDEIIEISALSLVNGIEAGEPFHRRVRPRRAEVPEAATAQHGLRWEDVRDAPPIERVLPEFIAYLGDAILIGYDCAGSLRFLDRDAGRILNQGFAPILVDTLPWGQRLANYARQGRLTDWLRRLKARPPRIRAGPAGCRQIAALLRELVAESKSQAALTALPESLPLVAAGTLSANVPIMEANAAWVEAGTRLATRQAGSALWARLIQLLGPDRGWEALQVEGRLRSMGVGQQARDEAWSNFRKVFEQQLDLFQKTTIDTSVSSFLAYAALASAPDTFNQEPDRVTFLTLSQMQGQNFPVVIISGGEQGHLPLGNPAPASPAFEMERRLFYVALTRARQRLYLCSTRDRGDRQDYLPSQFALELPTSLVRRVAVDAEGKFEVI